jgi:hypothetical protein
MTTRRKNAPSHQGPLVTTFSRGILEMTTATIERLIDEELGIDLIQTQEVLLEARWWLDQCLEDKAG